MRDFTIEKYRKLCNAIKANYKTLTFEDYLTKSGNKFIILRHDVDRMPRNALKVAEIEHESGIKSTYYFRMNKSVFRKEIIEKIVLLGHEIDYHYKCMDKANGNYEKAIKIFEDELKKFKVKDFNVNINNT